ncbi:gliding motility-associated C-terminal domain-containing protein, partial [Bacteroidota bacterium]
PHKSGAACNYDPNNIYLNGRKTEAGLPPEIPQTCYMDMVANTPCIGDTSWFDFNKCKFLIDSVLWDFGDSTTTLDSSTNLKPWYIYPKPGNYDVFLYVYYCGSVDTIKKDILILQKPYVNLGPDSSICANEPLMLYGGGGPYFLWNTGSTNQSIYVTQAGTYWLKASNICGDSYDTIVIENIWPAPYVSLPADTNICSGDSIILLIGDSNYTYIWHNTDTTFAYTAKYAGTYQLTAINEHGCKDSDDFTLSIIYPPQVKLGNDTSICSGNSILLDAGIGNNYLWNNGLNTQNFLIDTSGLVIIEVSNKCGYATDTINIKVENCEQKIYVPNAFTPNGDGENDLFFPLGYSIDWNTLQMYIYNRWGEQLYYTQDVNKGWDGTSTHSNKVCQLGVYVWLIIVKDIYGNDIKMTGSVTLLR